MTRALAHRLPTLRTGIGITEHSLRAITRGRRSLVVADARAGRGIPTGDSLAHVVELDAAAVGVESVATLARHVREDRPDLVVAIGGGTIIDAAKLAALAASGTALFEYAVEHAERSALTFLPARTTPPMEFAAVPTTPGTSSETNAVAILKNAHGYRLVVGRQLHARHAILDAENLMSLTQSAMREGCLEALLRTAGVNTSPRGPRTRPLDRDRPGARVRGPARPRRRGAAAAYRPIECGDTALSRAAGP
jgi:hypothetical protein